MNVEKVVKAAVKEALNKRFYLKDAQNYDLEKDTSWIRLIEMILDGGASNQGVVMQFFEDFRTYGLDEAITYAKSYEKDGYYNEGTVNEVEKTYQDWIKEINEGESKEDKDMEEPPSEEKMMEWMGYGVAEATDGCRVELDGYCEHGNPSWFIELGII